MRATPNVIRPTATRRVIVNCSWCRIRPPSITPTMVILPARTPWPSGTRERNASQARKPAENEPAAIQNAGCRYSRRKKFMPVRRCAPSAADFRATWLTVSRTTTAISNRVAGPSTSTFKHAHAPQPFAAKTVFQCGAKCFQLGVVALEVQPSTQRAKDCVGHASSKPEMQPTPFQTRAEQ